MTETIELKTDIASKLFGSYDANAKVVESEFGVKLRMTGGGLEIAGDSDAVAGAKKLLMKLIDVINAGYEVDRAKVRQSADMVKNGNAEDILKLSKDVVAVTAKGRQIRCKTLGQKNYAAAIKKNTLVFGIGPAGTGKTYLAVALAVAAFKNNEVEKIILTRPALEAGEKLGFLPGDLQDKVDPYLRPLYDALQEMFGIDSYTKLIERGIIEIAPLAYMRGRTLSNAFIILDEAQNTTKEQMKMFLTRMGYGSKVVVTGDVTQIDLPDKSACGLIQAVKILDSVEDIAVCRLTQKDVVRHELVQRIICAYADNNL